MKLFCYGTLMRGQRNHARLDGADFLQEAETSDMFAMFDNGSFPAIVYGENRIYGEIYEVPDEMWEMLDRLEGTSINFYERREMVVAGELCQYYYGMKVMDQYIRNWVEMPSGDYRDHK